MFRPFDNVVKLKFSGTGSSLHYKNIKSLKQIFSNSENSSNVTGIVVSDKGKTGYVSFTDHISKSNALSSTVGVENRFSMEDYDVTKPSQPDEEKVFRPFRYILTVPFRPSRVSDSRLVVHLGKFGPNFGKMFVPCPYDKDRMFLYFGYNNYSDLEKATMSQDISAVDVYHSEALSSGISENDVFVYSFRGHNKFSYGTYINILCKLPMNFQSLHDYFSQNYGDVSNLKLIWASEKFFVVHISFRDKYAVYRLFYHKTRFGRLTLPVPVMHGSTEEMQVTIPWVDQGLGRAIQQERLKYQRRHEINLHNVRDAPNTEQELMEFSNGFLDDMGCNPGIVSGFLFGPGSLSLKFANEWHSAHVAHRLLQLKEEGRHGYDVQVSTEWYSMLKNYFDD